MLRLVHELWWEDWKLYTFTRASGGNSGGGMLFSQGGGSFQPLLLEEILKHKWLASEKAKRDLGNQAIAEWFQRYWLKFCRGRRLEHVEGQRFWPEFKESDFALLSMVLRITEGGDLREFRELLLQILDLMKGRGASIHDNLEIIQWALNQSTVNLQRVHEFLLLIDINSARLPIPDEWKYIFAA
jgi:hypothetical protein